MELNNLRPAVGAVTSKTVSAVVPAPAKAEHPPAVTRVLSLVQATAAKSVSKAVRCLSSAVFPNSASKT